MALQEQPKGPADSKGQRVSIEEGQLTLHPGQAVQEYVEKVLPLGNGLSVPKYVHSVVMTSCGLTAWPSQVFRDLLQSAPRVDASKNSMTFEVTTEPEVNFFFPVNLTHLNLSCNKIRELPEEFWNLPGLVELDLSHNLLETLGDSFESARTVRELDLSHNYLQRPPRWLSGLTRARTVRLNDNTMASAAFDGVGADFGKNCRSLRFLDISSCALRGLNSPHVFQAKDLKVLILGRSEEGEDGEEELSAAAVSILRNSISSLPREIGLSSGLVTLVASGINLSDVPDEIRMLRNLRRLDLSRNDIHWLPPTLVDLERLEVLNLSGNHLDSLPFKIERLPSLRELYVASNGVCWITEDIGRSRCRLRVLDLYQNRLDLEGARPLKDLDLEQLDLGSNQLCMDDIVQDMNIADYLDKQARLRDSLGVSQAREDPGQDAPAKPDDDYRSLGQSWTTEDDEASLEADASEEADVESNSFFEEGGDNDPWLDCGEEKREQDLAMRASPPRFLWTELGMGEEKAKTVDEEEEEETWSSDGRYSGTSSNHCRAPRYDFDDMSKYISGRFDFCPSDGHARTVREQGARAARASLECPSEKRPGRRVPLGAVGRRAQSGRDRAESSGSDGNLFADAD